MTLLPAKPIGKVLVGGISVTKAKIKTTAKKHLKAGKDSLPYDHSAHLNRLRRIRGQVDGVERMISDRRYCPEIIQQIKATRSALRSLECLIVEGHMEHCVKQAFDSRDPDLVQTKLDEILLLMKGQG